MLPDKFIKNLDGRQHSDWLYVEISHENFVANNNIVEIEAPKNSEINQGFVNVITAGNGGTTDTIDIGDPTDDDRYTGTALDIKTTGRKAITPTGFIYGRNGSTQKVRITRVSSGTAPTAGLIRVALEFLQDGKWYLTQG